MFLKRDKAKEELPLKRDYWRLWSAHAISNLGDGISSVAYPWLASAVTRSPILIALVAVVSRLPWLVFTLPAGVITDRLDRRKVIVAMDAVRGLLALIVAAVVSLQAGSLNEIDKIASGSRISTNWILYFTLVITALLFGCAEVLRDNAAQTLLPSVVEENQLERANGKLWSVEFLANSFVGPPLGSFILGIAIFLPFYFDSATFFISAALIFSLFPKKFDGSSSDKQIPKVKMKFGVEIREGFSWLWRHELLRPMAIILGLMNALGSMMTAVFILFAQEVLDTSVFVFALLGTAGAIGGIVGGIIGPRISARLGSGRSLALTLWVMPLTGLVIGLTDKWQVLWLLTAISTVFAVLWNVITVSLRQSIIPANLLGRVNSVYRFFGWGSIPIGALIGGALVSIMERFASREFALRSPYFLSAILGLILMFFAIPKLTTEKIEKARAIS